METAENPPTPGKLKIFLGMSAGVGKTYTMLREARNLKEKGVDVLLSWLEPHGRAETDAQAQGLRRLAPLEVRYKTLKVQEFDLDGVLALRPRLVLIDELAHSNTPGMKHPKRWQDVFDLLAAGIDVHTTVNIQHLESVADTVEELSGIKVRERVPDRVFDRADNIQVIDISPEDLRLRLEEGRVYTGEASRQAVDNFFRLENLTALREMALSQAAKTAGNQLSDFYPQDDQPASAFLGDRGILVAVSPSPNSEYLLRWTRRLAFSLKAEWTCLYVETGMTMSDQDKERLMRHLSLARNLGARVSTMIGLDVPDAILHFARHHHHQVLVVGKSGITAPRFFRPAQGITDRLIRDSGPLSVIAVQEGARMPGLPSRVIRRVRASQPWQFAAALGGVALATGVNFVLAPWAGYVAASIIYLGGISLMGMVIGRRALFMAGLLSALLWNLLFIPPRFTLMISRTEDVFLLVLFFLLALTSGWATSKIKSYSQLLEQREARMEFLSGLSEDLSVSQGLEDAARRGTKALDRAFGVSTFLVMDRRGGQKGKEFMAGTTRVLDTPEQSALEFARSSGQSTGKFTSTLPGIDLHLVPLAAQKGILGVIGLDCRNLRALGQDQEDLLQTMVRTISMALEREVLAEENRANLLSQESERLSTVLLHSISHELRTPLTVVKGCASALLDEETAGDKEVRTQMLDSILESTGVLNQTIENLLSFNRLESGVLRLNLENLELSDLIETALARSKDQLAGRQLRHEGTGQELKVRGDEVLLVQVIQNLVSNACRYTPPGSPLELLARVDHAGHKVELTLRDFGPGLPEAELSRIFDKFFRGSNAVNGGTGLGLTICKGIIELHHGTMRAKNQEGGGLAITLTLPEENADETRTGN